MKSFSRFSRAGRPSALREVAGFGTGMLYAGASEPVVTFHLYRPDGGAFRVEMGVGEAEKFVEALNNKVQYLTGRTTRII